MWCFLLRVPWLFGSLERPQLQHSSCSWSPSLQQLEERRQTGADTNKRKKVNEKQKAKAKMAEVTMGRLTDALLMNKANAPLCLRKRPQ